MAKQGQAAAAASAAREKLQKVGEGIEERYRQVSADVRRGAEKASAELRRGAETAKERYGETTEQLKQGYDRAREQARVYQSDLTDFVQERPGTALAVAAIAGFVVGLLFRGRRE